MLAIEGGAVVGQHWLYSWIDEFDIKSGEHASHLLSYPGAVERLHEMATSAPGWHEGEAPAGRSIVAGSTMDFSGRMNCAHSGCLEKQVDRLFSRVWHYFDSVVVEGPSPESYQRAITQRRSNDPFGLPYTVEEDVSFLLRLRELGVTEHLDFRSKPDAFCTHHIEKHATEAGLPHLLDQEFRQEIAKKLKRESQIKITSGINGEWHYSLVHPEYSEPFSGYFNLAKKKGAKKPTKAQVAEAVVRRSSAALIYDVAASKRLSLPLAEEFTHLHSSPILTEGAREASIALQLPLPVMHGMSSRDIIKMRTDMRPHFDRFQHALTLAIREQIERDPERADPAIAKAVSAEFIRPAFADIERSLVEAKRSLSVKSAASLAVGSTVASVGILASVPLVVGAGLAAAVGITLSGLHKHVDEKKEVKTCDVYFLWKANDGSVQ
ncbi:hypothetical protein [Streptomyces sp. NPDC048200]|uniref:hypothetical protein n=1 Tax=Streptomyces sp. NPDC048200 TaxID=3365512 RepID=UPI00371FB967